MATEANPERKEKDGLVKNSLKMECDICWERFSFKRRSRQPYVGGSCGHSFCLRCAMQLRRKRKCGRCRAPFKPVKNFALIDCMEKMEELKTVLRGKNKKLKEKLKQADVELEEETSEESDPESEESEVEEIPAPPRTQRVNAPFGDRAAEFQQIYDVLNVPRDPVLDEDFFADLPRLQENDQYVMQVRHPRHPPFLPGNVPQFNLGPQVEHQPQILYRDPPAFPPRAPIPNIPPGFPPVQPRLNLPQEAALGNGFPGHIARIEPRAGARLAEMTNAARADFQARALPTFPPWGHPLPQQQPQRQQVQQLQQAQHLQPPPQQQQQQHQPQIQQNLHNHPYQNGNGQYGVFWAPLNNNHPYNG